MVETPDALVELSLREEVARRAKGARSWADVARRSGLQPTSISHVLAGKVRLADVRLGTVAKLCAALGIDIGDILSVQTAPRGNFVRTDRPITAEEFAAAVREILEEPLLPCDWTGPVEEDLGEASYSPSTSIKDPVPGQPRRGVPGQPSASRWETAGEPNEP